MEQSLPRPARRLGRDKAEGPSAGSSRSLQELLFSVSLVQRTFLFLLQSFGIFISLCDSKCKIISMAAPAAGWLASQLLLVSKVVEVAGWRSQREPEPFASLASRWSMVMLELGWDGVREAPPGQTHPSVGLVLGVLINVCIFKAEDTMRPEHRRGKKSQQAEK